MLCNKHRRCTILERMMLSIGTARTGVLFFETGGGYGGINHAGGDAFTATIPSAKGDHLVCRCTGLWFYIDLFCDEHQHNGEASRGQHTADPVRQAPGPSQALALRAHPAAVTSASSRTRQLRLVR